MKTIEAVLHDGTSIAVEVKGTGPAVLLPVNPVPAEGAEADEKRKWGVDPRLGLSFIEGLGDVFTVVAFDYEGRVLRQPKPDTLTPENIASDLLAIAEAAGCKRFAYYGYSWLALAGMQLAIRSDRLWALIMGGYPPIGGPYREMLAVTKATHVMTIKPKAPAVETRAGSEFDWDTVGISLTEAQTRQFLTLYEALRDFDDKAVQDKIDCPRLCFAGSADKIVYGKRWGDTIVDIAGPFVDQAGLLTNHGWDVRMLDGLDHTQAMQPSVVLPVIRPWLIRASLLL